MIIFVTNSYAVIWTEKTHNDFSDGKEYYYISGDTASYWNATNLRKWNLGSRVYSPSEGGLRVIGQDWDLDDNGWLDAILTSGDVLVYWNSSSGFNTSNKAVLFAKIDAQGLSLCDLNRDGRLEILIGERDAELAYIYDGNTYAKFDSVKVLWGNQDLTPADLNNDGEVDLITPAATWSYIYYGPGPFYPKKPMDSLYIPDAAPGSAHRTTVADLNYDGFLDIAMSCQAGKVYIFWGSSTGWKTQTVLSCTYNWDHSIADLNKDGYLDIFVNHHTSNGIIFYGSASGFVTTVSTPGNGTGDCSIVDINNDDTLDIIANCTNGNSYIMWGPNYSSYVNLPISSGCGTEVADFNNDGSIDILSGGLNGQSYLYWNNGGFLSTNKFTFPVSSNDAVWEDLGNIWDRSEKQRYLSNIFDAPDSIIKVDSVRWWANIPSGMDIKVSARAALDTSVWEKWTELPNGGTDSSLFLSRYLQYKCEISTDYKNTSLFSFDSIKFYYDTGAAGVSEKTSNAISSFNVFTQQNLSGNKVSFNFEIPVSGKLSLTIYNVAGEKIKKLIDNKYYDIGTYKEIWNKKNENRNEVKTGIYFCVAKLETQKDKIRKIGKFVIIGE
ncbi:MAG: VCBS repeat-containing protein [bacterium]|nr:VCBS repeat-containing protein [bacterium]